MCLKEKSVWSIFNYFFFFSVLMVEVQEKNHINFNELMDIIQCSFDSLEDLKKEKVIMPIGKVIFDIFFVMEIF